MKFLSVLILSVFMSFFYSNSVFSQDNPQDTTENAQLYVITKNDGSEYVGKILSDDGREVLILTENLGKIYINKSDIKSMVKIDEDSLIVNGEFRSEGPFTTRYAFTTNALPIKKRENYALINLYGPEVHFAVSNKFSIGIMTTWIASPFVLAAKYSIPTKNEKVNISLGTLFGTSGYLNNFRGFGGLHFMNVTFGSRMSNITFGGGYGYISYGWSNNYNAIPDEGTYINSDGYIDTYGGNYPTSAINNMTKGPVFSLAGITRVGKKASFIFDSMIGIRFRTTYTSQTTELVAPYNDPNPPYNYISGTYQHVIKHETDLVTGFFLMPGMRFQSTDRSAFQVSMAGVITFVNGDVISFPVPMCTWFFKF